MPQRKDQNREAKKQSGADNPQVQQLLAQYQTIAGELHNSGNEATTVAVLSPITEQDEATQIALLKVLAREQSIPAADIAAAIYAHGSQKEVRKEARRTLLKLESTNIYPQWQPEAKPALLNMLTDETPQGEQPRFWKGLTTDTKESGEVQLILFFEQDVNYKEVRVLGFLLEFWNDGVKDCFTEVRSKSSAQRQIEQMRERLAIGDVHLVECDLSEARLLLEEALAVNQRKGTKPHTDFERQRPLINQLILEADEAYEGEMEDEEEENAILKNPLLSSLSNELQSFLVGSRTEEAVATFLQDWAEGRYGKAYNQLASNSPLREGLAREQWIARRRQWRQNALPHDFKIDFLRDRSSEDGEPVVVEGGWSLAFANSSPASTLPELPTATLTFDETQRHWLWSSYTLVEEDGTLRLYSISDEGQNAHQLPEAELRQRLDELKTRIDEIQAQLDEEESEEIEEAEELEEEIEEEELEEAAEEEGEEDVEDEETDLDEAGETLVSLAERIEETLQISALTMYYNDVLISRFPDEEQAYKNASAIAESIPTPDHERAAAYMQRMLQHFPDPQKRADALEGLALAYLGLEESHQHKEEQGKAEHYHDQAEQKLREAIAINQAPAASILLAHALIERNTAQSLDEAGTVLQNVNRAELTSQQEATLETALGRLAEERGETEAALRHYQRTAELDENAPYIWANIGHIQTLLGQIDEAEQSLLRSIDQEEVPESAYVELALLYAEEKDDSAQAIALAEQGLEENPYSADLRAVLAIIYVQENDIKLAEKYLSTAESMSENSPFVRRAREIVDQLKAEQKRFRIISSQSGKQQKRKKKKK
ncbi:MAG: tetratricopeptide repeat protein [Ktedonobacteraceae bacterium]|nr:tetratricopeptide repeat protein [Ktedonobacteraceae bacterium]